MDWGRKLEIVGSVDTHGTAQAVALRGDLAFVCASWHGLVTVDVSDPAAPKIIGGCDTPGLAFDIALKDDYAFVADRFGGLQVISIADPAQPRLVTTYDTLEFATGIALAGDLLFLPCRAHGLDVVDISHPEQPRHLGFARTGESQGVAVREHYAYVGVWGESKLAIVDISDPCRPEIVCRHGLHGYGYGLTVKGDYAFCAHGHHDKTMGDAGKNHGHGFDVVDISDPANPETVAVIKTPDYYVGGPDSWQCEISGEHLFLADGLNGLYVFDISDPTNPQPVAHCDTPGYAHNLDIGDGLAFVADCRGGLQIVDAEGLADGLYEEQGVMPAVPAGCPPFAVDFPNYLSAGQVRGVAAADGYAYLASGSEGLEILTLEPEPTHVARLDTPGIAYDVTVEGDVAYLADGPAGVAIVDVSDRTEPRLLARAAEGKLARQVVKFGDRLLVMEGNATIEVINVADPSAPTQEGIVKLKHFAVQIADQLLDGRYAVVGHGFALGIIDLEAEGGPDLAISHQTRRDINYYPCGVALLDGNLLTTSSRQLRTFDLSDPEQLVELGRARTSLNVRRITLHGGLAYISCETSGGIVVADLSDPSEPRVIKEIPTPGHPHRVVIASESMLVADGYAGLHVVPLEETQEP